MAENPLEGILGDDEAPEEATSQGREAQTDAFAAILASNLPLLDPEVARRTREYLDKQSRLLELQANQLVAEVKIPAGPFLPAMRSPLVQRLVMTDRPQRRSGKRDAHHDTRDDFSKRLLIRIHASCARSSAIARA